MNINKTDNVFMVFFASHDKIRVDSESSVVIDYLVETNDVGIFVFLYIKIWAIIMKSTVNWIDPHIMNWYGWF